MDADLHMDTFNRWLMLPPALTMVLILLLLGFSKKRGYFWENKLIVSLILTFFVLNVIEVITYGGVYDNFDALLRLYYSFIFIAATLIILLSDKLNEKPITPRIYSYPITILITTFLISSTLFTNWIVEGVIINNLSISRVAGRHYWLFQLYIFCCVVIGPLLIIRSIKTTNPLNKRRSKVILISFLPLIFTVLLVLFLMQLGAQINWSIFLPISTLVFIIAYLFTENRNDLFKLLVNIPFSHERKAYKLLNKRVIDYISKTELNEKVSLKSLVSDIESTFISNALEIKDGDHNLAAELLSISISTVYRNKDRSNE